MSPATLVIPSVVGTGLAYFAVMAGRQIALPGLYYDELMWVHIATGAPTDEFVAQRIRGIPVMVLPYLGALKAYLYAPIVAAVGISPESIRVPTISISLLTLGVGFAAARQTFRPAFAALLVVLMAADPIFIFMSKADYGPTVLMMLFKISALFFVFRFLASSSPAYLWALALVCALGLYDKLNFLWFVLALIGATTIAFWPQLRAAAATQALRFFWPVTALCVIAVLATVYSFPQFVHDQPYEFQPQRLAEALRLYLATMDSREMWFMASPYSFATLSNWVTVPAIGAVLVTVGWRLVRAKGKASLHPRDRVLGFYGLLFLLVFAQFAVTTAAENPNHAMMLYPLHFFLLVGGLDRLNRLPAAFAPPARLSLVSFSSTGFLALPLGVLLIASQVDVGFRYQAGIDNRAFHHTWSPAIYELARHVDDRDVDVVVSAEWGIHNQVFALARPEHRERYVNLWQEFASLDDPGHPDLAREFFEGRRVLAIVWTIEEDPGRDSFLAFAQHHFGGTVLERVVHDDHGKPIFAIHYIDGRDLAARP